MNVIYNVNKIRTATGNAFRNPTATFQGHE